jgi:hypothetical protein
MSGEEKKEKGKVEEVAEKTGEVVGGGFSSLWSSPHFVLLHPARVFIGLGGVRGHPRDPTS